MLGAIDMPSFGVCVCRSGTGCGPTSSRGSPMCRASGRQPPDQSSLLSISFRVACLGAPLSVQWLHKMCPIASARTSGVKRTRVTSFAGHGASLAPPHARRCHGLAGVLLDWQGLVPFDVPQQCSRVGDRRKAAVDHQEGAHPACGDRWAQLRLGRRQAMNRRLC